jgi:hypothetical protein
MTKTTIEADQIRAAAQAKDFETFHRLTTERDSTRKAAVDRGFASAVESGFGKPDYSPAERAGIETLVDRLADTLETAGVGEEQILTILEDWTDRMAEAPIRAKLELAVNLDSDLTNGEPAPGGILDRALDEVIETLRPYAERASGWYKFHGLNQ